jgi:hypothetical protein
VESTYGLTDERSPIIFTFLKEDLAKIEGVVLTEEVNASVIGAMKRQRKFRSINIHDRDELPMMRITNVAYPLKLCRPCSQRTLSVLLGA